MRPGCQLELTLTKTENDAKRLDEFHDAYSARMMLLDEAYVNTKAEQAFCALDIADELSETGQVAPGLLTRYRAVVLAARNARVLYFGAVPLDQQYAEAGLTDAVAASEVRVRELLARISEGGSL